MDLTRIISGAQIGADIAGLRAAKNCGLETGGTVNKGCKTKEGNKPFLIEQFNLTEIDSERYSDRTSKNVQNSDATIRFAHNFDSPGEKCTAKFIRKYEKISIDIRVTADGCDVSPEIVALWLQMTRISVLNVTGNASVWIEPIVQSFLEKVIGILR